MPIEKPAGSLDISNLKLRAYGQPWQVLLSSHASRPVGISDTQPYFPTMETGLPVNDLPIELGSDMVRISTRLVP